MLFGDDIVAAAVIDRLVHHAKATLSSSDRSCRHRRTRGDEDPPMATVTGGPTEPLHLLILLTLVLTTTLDDHGQLWNLRGRSPLLSRRLCQP